MFIDFGILGFGDCESHQLVKLVGFSLAVSHSRTKLFVSESFGLAATKAVNSSPTLVSDLAVR